jgi:hypothetical protein
MDHQAANLNTLKQFIAVLEEFKKEKRGKWEKIDDAVQAKNRPGSPTEDIIIPPDENITERLLMEDEKYCMLKKKIKELRHQVESISLSLGIKSHPLHWLEFDNPLIGNAALEDCIYFGKSLMDQLEAKKL